MAASLANALTRAKQLRAEHSALGAVLLDEFTYAVGPRGLRPVHAALETIAGLPAHHRDTPEADSPSAPVQWLWDWCRARQAERAQQLAAAKARYLATKAA